MGRHPAMCGRVVRPLCGSPKCPALKRPYPPGQTGPGRRQRLSEYGRRLLEKQKLRFTYGVLERQFRRYFQRAQRSRGNTGERLLQLLETRLDNLVYRLGFAPTIWAARQLVVHGHIQVNGRKVDRPSYQVRPGDVIAVREKSRSIPLIQESLQNAQRVPDYLSVEPEKFQGTLLRAPAREEIPVDVEESLIVEFYSR